MSNNYNIANNSTVPTHKKYVFNKEIDLDQENRDERWTKAEEAASQIVA